MTATDGAAACSSAASRTRPMSGASSATRKAEAVISATATGRASPPATIRLRVTSRQAPSSVTDRSVPRQTVKSCSARSSTLFAATSQLRMWTMRSPAGSGSVGRRNSDSTWKMTVPTQIAKAIASPPTTVRPGYFTSMRPPSLRSRESPSKPARPRPCLLPFTLHALLAGDFTFARRIELGAAGLDRTVALVVSDHDARARHARSCQLVSVRRRPVGEQLLAAAEHDRDGEDGHRVNEVVGQERMDEVGAALGDKTGAVFVPQAPYVGDAAQENRALPARIDHARARNRVLRDLLEELRDAAIWSAFVVVRPIRRENLVGLAAEQEIEWLAEEAVEL